MKHKIIIWSKNKESGRNFRVETEIIIDENDINEFALKKYKDGYYLDENKEYWGEIDETTI